LTTAIWHLGRQPTTHGRAFRPAKVPPTAPQKHSHSASRKAKIERFLGSSKFQVTPVASIDIQETAGPRKDGLGLSCFVFHVAFGGFVLAGWLVSSTEALLVYLVLLPAM